MVSQTLNSILTHATSLHITSPHTFTFREHQANKRTFINNQSLSPDFTTYRPPISPSTLTMPNESTHIREQTLANARLLLRHSTNTPTQAHATADRSDISQMTLVPTHTGDLDLDVVVFGSSNSYTAAVMVGLTPAIEGEAGKSSEGAIFNLFTATCELLKMYIPKVVSQTPHSLHITRGECSLTMCRALTSVIYMAEASLTR